MRLALAVVLAISLAPLAAHADTVIAGGNLSTQTWTAANSPYVVQGDITVIAGATLTIDAGVEVRAVANSDSQLAGRSTNRVEITVAGSLVANGTAAQPVTFKSSATSAGSWYGIIGLAGATQVKLDHVAIESATYGVISETTGTELQLTSSTVSNASSYGVWLKAGNPTVSDLTVLGASYGVFVSDAASPTLVRATIRNNSSGGVYISHNTPGKSVEITSCTINQNGSYGVYSSASSSANAATITVKSSIVTNHSYGVYRADNASWSVTYSNVWNNSNGNYVGISAGTGTITSNPLYVSATDLRLTSNSPSRFGAEIASMDQGSLPYDGVATPGLYGVLWANTTLLAATGSYTASGDLTVAPGVTLTIEPGVTLSFNASSDLMLSGQSTNRGELTVRGTLIANGTPANPITIGSTSTSAGSWYGIQLDTTAHDSVLDDLRVRYATYGLIYASTGTGNQISNMTVESASSYGYYLRAGSPSLDMVQAIGASYGFFVADSASVTLTRCIARNNSSGGVYITHNTPGHSVSLTRCTINQNGSYGVYSSASSSANAATVTVTGSIITNHSYGVYRADNASWSVTHSNVWNNSNGNYVGISAGTATISSNPLYVSATDLRLTSNSPSRFGAPSNIDQGALPYDTVATPGLYGVLWSNTTLTTAGGPYTASGDLTVAPNTTLTIEPGVTLSFNASSDLMLSGQSTNRGELTVQGTLVADGTPANPITISSASTSAGSWYGIDFDTGAHASQLDNVRIRYATYGLQYRSTAVGNSFKNVTIESASSYGAWLRQGSPSLDALTVFGASYGVFVGDAASATLTNCVLRNNSSGGIYVSPSTPGKSVAVTNCTVNQNGSYGMYTSASSSSNAATVSVTNSIITNHSYGVYRADNSSWSVTYSDVWNNSNGNYVGISAGTGTITANPQFASATDLHLTSTSVAIDAGTTGPNTDLDGHARPLDGNGVGGPQWDLGAYEYISTIQCGNGAVEGTETCDDGAMNGTYGHCNAQCNGLGPRCGDGTMNGPEQCDDGNALNTDACLNSCVTATCGDGFVRTGVEQCDDANTSNTDACLDTCMAATCGDGFVRVGIEPCDDGNQSNNDACLDTCTIATCGDGFTQTGVEDCDDGNQSNTDACLNVCESATCGDGFIQTGVEGCDDGNMVDTDACSNTCVASTCGNGTVEGTEQCDDGNKVESDMCRNNCTDARCGDGVIAGGIEECDDGNTDPGDGCDELCTTEGGTTNPDPTSPDGGGGCCDSSTRGGEAGSLFLAALVLFGIRRRRRRDSGTAREQPASRGPCASRCCSCSARVMPALPLCRSTKRKATHTISRS